MVLEKMEINGKLQKTIDLEKKFNSLVKEKLELQKKLDGLAKKFLRTSSRGELPDMIIYQHSMSLDDPIALSVDIS